MNAVIYARYSSDNQREESIEGQLRECKEYADQNGITVVRTYIDRALSAKTDSRPQFQQMIHDSATHTFEAVLVWKLDRFSRNRYDSAHYKRILKNNRVHVVSVTEPISNTPEGIMLESLLEGMAEGIIQRSWPRRSAVVTRRTLSRPSSTEARCRWATALTASITTRSTRPPRRWCRKRSNGMRQGRAFAASSNR